MRTIENVWEDYRNDKYTYTSVVAPPKLPENYVFDENRTVKENRQMVEENNELRKRIIHENIVGQNNLIKKLREEIVEILMNEYKFNKKQAEFIESRCYERNHAFFNDYFSNIEDDAQEFYDFMRLE